MGLTAVPCLAVPCGMAGCSSGVIAGSYITFAPSCLVFSLIVDAGSDSDLYAKKVSGMICFLNSSLFAGLQHV